MTLKPIPGAPIGAPIPDFPTGEPGPLDMPGSRLARHPVPASPVSLPPPSPARRPGPIEIRGVDGSTITLRCIPEVPAINRSSMTISVTGQAAGDRFSRVIIDLAPDKAKAFLLALRGGDSPVGVADSRTGFQVEFSKAADGSVFTVNKPGQEHSVRRFEVRPSIDVKMMAAHLLADLGP